MSLLMFMPRSTAEDIAFVVAFVLAYAIVSVLTGGYRRD